MPHLRGSRMRAETVSAENTEILKGIAIMTIVIREGRKERKKKADVGNVAD